MLLRPSTISGTPPSPLFFTAARLSPERERSALPDQAGSGGLLVCTTLLRIRASRPLKLNSPAGKERQDKDGPHPLPPMSRTLGPAGEKEEPFLSLSISLSLCLGQVVSLVPEPMGGFISQWEKRDRWADESWSFVCDLVLFSQRSSIVLSNARRRWGVEELVNGGGE